MPQLPAPDRKTMTSSGVVLRRRAPPPRTHELTMVITAGDIMGPILVAGGARLLENAQDIYWVGSGVGTFQLGAISIFAACRMYTNTDSNSSAVAPRGDPLMRDAAGLFVFDIAVSAACIFGWVHPFAEQIYWIGIGSGTVLLAIAGSYAAPAMQAVASTSKKDSYQIDGLLADFNLRVARDRFEEKLEERGLLAEYSLRAARDGFEERLEDVRAEYDRKLQLTVEGMLASKRADAAFNKAELGSVSKKAAFNEAKFDIAFQALKDFVAPPIAADESVSSEVFNKLMIDTQQKVDQLTLMEAEFIAKLEEDRKQME